eukprot:Clim_evm1s235 gene=Clim_evmTU1s235
MQASQSTPLNLFGATQCTPNDRGAGYGWIPSGLLYDDVDPFECDEPMSPEEARERLWMYAPTLYHHAHERHKLTSINNFIDEAKIYEKDSDEEPWEASLKEILRISNLPYAGSFDAYQLVRYTSEPKESGDGADEAPIYGTVFKDEDGFTVFAYFYFYEFNSRTGQTIVYNSATDDGDEERVVYASIDQLGVHHGDVEYMQVAVCRGGERPVGVSAVAHGHTQFKDCRTDDCRFEGSNGEFHTPIYVAMGGHASYFEPGAQYYHFLPIHVIPPFIAYPLVDVIVSDYSTTDGDVFRPSPENVIFLSNPDGEQLDPTDPLLWRGWRYSFGGRFDAAVTSITCYDDTVTNQIDCPTDDNWETLRDCIGLEGKQNCNPALKGLLQEVLSDYTGESFGPTGPFEKAQATNWVANRPLDATDDEFAVCPGEQFTETETLEESPTTDTQETLLTETESDSQGSGAASAAGIPAMTTVAVTLLIVHLL